MNRSKEHIILLTIASFSFSFLLYSTMCLAAIIICQIANGLQCRSLRNLIFKIGFFKNKHIFLGIATELLLILAFAYILFFQKFLGTGPLELKHWLFFVPFAILIFVVEEIRKALKRRLDRKTEKLNVV